MQKSAKNVQIGCAGDIPRAIELHRSYFNPDAIAILDIRWKFQSDLCNTDLATMVDL
jgi:hypothetical protein